jgi:hypothetical protein
LNKAASAAFPLSITHWEDFSTGGINELIASRQRGVGVAVATQIRARFD